MKVNVTHDHWLINFKTKLFQIEKNVLSSLKKGRVNP
jgi:hypothetical protein